MSLFTDANAASRAASVVAHGAGPAVNRMGKLVTQAWRAWRNRREFYRLGEMSDTELADIGLTRADLHVAINGPFGADPTARLGVMAERRLRSIEDGARLCG